MEMSPQSPNVGMDRSQPNHEKNPEVVRRYQQSQKEWARGKRDRDRAAKLNHPLIKSIPKFKENHELYEMMCRWEKLYPTPNQEHVLAIIADLVQKPFESLPTFKVNFSNPPTAAHLVHDIFDDNEIEFRNCITGKNEGSRCEFFACWLALADNPNSNINCRHQIPYSAWGVKASENGLLSCGVTLPEFLLQPGVYVSPVRNGDELSLENWRDRPLFHSIFTPAATVTDIHDDNVLSASTLIQVYGEKILFTWRGTKTNREFFGGCHGTEHGLRLREALEKMTDGFKVNILKPGVGVKMEYGMIHAVVSITNSVISCWEYVDAKWLDCSQIEEGFKWEIGLIKSRKPLPSDDNEENIYNGLRYGTNLWRCLGLKLAEGGEALKDRANQVQLLVEYLEPQIPEENAESSQVRRSNDISTKDRHGKKRVRRAR